MQYEFTSGASRALTAAAGWRSREDCNELRASALLLGLLAESECRAAIMLANGGIDAAAIRRRWPELSPATPPTGGVGAIVRRFSSEVESSLNAVCQRLAEYSPAPELATEHLLLGLAAAEHEVSAWLRQHGLDPDTLEAEICRLYGYRPGSLPLELEEEEATSLVPGELGETGENAENQDISEKAEKPPGCGHDRTTSGSDRPSRPSNSVPPPWRDEICVLRVIDAAANRAREGLRVVEDFVRFFLDDRHLTGQCKQLRHDLAAAVGRISAEHRLAGRETQADVGTGLTTKAEEARDKPAAVLAANFTRLQEALRSLEEFGKLIDANMAAELKQLRYRSYTLQRALETTRTSVERLERARLYVLIDGRPSQQEFQRLAALLVEAGVDMIQLREKQLDDCAMLARARVLRELAAGSDTLFIVNDRPDLAALSRADGVHLGQEDLSVKDARAIVGPEPLVGVSTHSIEQARQAVLDGANYIGVGPTFPSGTKQFDRFPGVALLRAVSSEIRLPAFAIGGITHENLPEVLRSGFVRIAVGGAITDASDAAAATRKLLSELP